MRLVSARDAAGLPLLEKACDGGRVNACTNLALALLAGIGFASTMTDDFAKNGYQRAATLIEGACAKAWPTACEELTRLTLSKERLRAAFEKACGAEPAVGIACHEVARLDAYGHGGPVDQARAEMLARKACDLDVLEACLLELQFAENKAAGKKPTARIERPEGVYITTPVCAAGTKKSRAFVATAVALNQRKAKLDACVKASTKTPVEITAAKGKLTKVTATGADANVNRCVTRALEGGAAAFDGTCSFTMTHGK